MSQGPTFTRRDERKELQSGAASVEFPWQGPDDPSVRGEVITVGAAGLSFTPEGDSTIAAGAILTPVIIRFRESIIRGDLSVRFARPVSVGSGTEFGCLFYPASPVDSALWMVFAEQRPDNGSTAQPLLPLRCSNCHSTLWICDPQPANPVCPKCSQEYRFGNPISGPQLEDLHLQARGMALELRIDLASAVSMLLDTLTLADVRDILDEAPPAEAVATAPNQDRKRRFDPAFQPAIEAGTLTEVQAIQRGNREAFSKRLVARHRIRLDEAYDIADNRTSLLILLRKRTAGQPIITRKRRRASPARLVAVVALAGIGLLVGVGLVRLFDEEMNRPAAEAQAQPGGPAAQSEAVQTPAATPLPDFSALPVDAYARVRANEQGEILSIEAADPGDVLVAFCESQGPARRLDPVDVIPTDPPSDATRLGVLRNLAAEQEYYAVVIRRDPQTRRWFLGNAASPDVAVSMFPAPEQLVRAAKNRL